jgi:HSP20 family molecular chaperone IbpA
MYYPNLFNPEFANDFFDEMLNLPFGYGKQLRNEVMDKKRCTTDIKEFDDRYELDMEFPGFNKEDIKAELKKGYLVVSAVHSKNSERTDKPVDGASTTDETTAEDAAAKESTSTPEPKYLCRERFHGKVERSFYVGNEIKKDDIKAQYTNGVLTLQIPKKVSRPDNESEIISIMD